MGISGKWMRNRVFSNILQEVK